MFRLSVDEVHGGRGRGRGGDSGQRQRSSLVFDVRRPVSTGVSTLSARSQQQRKQDDYEHGQ